MFDILIRNARIVSGSGNPWFNGDLGVIEGRIAAIGRLDAARAARTIDAAGRVACPGFIDGHTHSDLFLLAEPRAEAKVLQGVTTENLGLDGMSVAPIEAAAVAGWRKHLSGLTGDPGVDWTWRGFADYLDAVDAAAPSLNVTSYVGLGTLRLKVMGMTDRAASGAEIAAMKSLAAEAMEEGARGISAGLIYAPGLYQGTEEVVAIAKVVRDYDGIYDVHLRSEGGHVMEALDEVIGIGRASGIPILITHFKVNGKDNWGRAGEALAKVDDARRQGVEVHIAQYPYTAGSTMLHAVIPPWYHAKGPDALIGMLGEDREAIKRDIRERHDFENFVAGCGWERIVVSSVSGAANKRFEGKPVSEIAALKGLDDPADAALDLLAEEELSVGMIVFSMDEADVVEIMRHPTMSVISDGLLGGGKPHPRAFGAFPRILGRYVREKGVLRLEEAVRKMTALSAEKLRLKTKGLLAEGYDADIVVFDPDTVIDNATFDNPRQPPTGIDLVIVNGQVVVADGRHTGATPGRTIRTR